MRLLEALRITPTSRVAFVGSGGKSSAVLRLGSEFPSSSIMAATAHFGLNHSELVKRHIIWTQDNYPENMDNYFQESCLITGPKRDDETLLGVEESQWDILRQISEKLTIPVFIEADGSKRRPLKWPASHEPPIPEWVNQVVIVVGLSILGKDLNSENVHRAELFSDNTGIEIGREVDADVIIRMLLSENGGLKNIPSGAKKTVIFNQFDTLKEKSALKILKDSLLPTYDSVVFSSLQSATGSFSVSEQPQEVSLVFEKTAGIILAAGNSKRMGKNKALLDWKGIPFIRACALSSLESGLNPVQIIAGQDFGKIVEAVNGLPVNVIENHDWLSGQSSSIKTGIRSLPDFIGGVVFQLVDQPQIPATLIRQMVDEHYLSLSNITLPESGGRRANPVLFDQITFPDLLTLEGDIGGRGIFHKYSIKLVPWNDESILLDVDTPEDYETLLGYWDE